MPTPPVVVSEARKVSPPARTSHNGTPTVSSSRIAQSEAQLPTLRGRLSSRTLAEPKSPMSGPPPLPRRRSSILSFTSLDDTRHTARDFIRPGLGLESDDLSRHEDPSHWHSSPLAFAFLPALAGLFFTNGSAFVTDALLLGLAALFLNWSVRLPWDWYRSAQVQVHSPPSRRSSVTLETFDEADEDDMNAPDGDGYKSESYPQNNRPKSPTTKPEEQDEAVTDAALQLGRHELFALLMTFIMPAGAAYLLHVIRSQLSRPSEGLVSDYNLTIFLLAAEIRPVRQLIRLTTNRTLHLQRIVSDNRDPSGSSSGREESLEDLAARLAALEAKTEDSNTAVGIPTPHEDLVDLSTDMKRRYEPRLDALERAVRRYEKRATTLTLLTEQRLQSLESRLQDALSLAAVAAQSNNKPGLALSVASALGTFIMLPFDALRFFLIWPLLTAEIFLTKAGEFIYGRPKQRPRKIDTVQSRSRVARKKEEAYSGRH